MNHADIALIFSGDKFSPQKLQKLKPYLVINSIIEPGETATRGRYKGKPSPYGMAVVPVELTKDFTQVPTHHLFEFLEQFLKNNKKLIKETGVEDIVVDIVITTKTETTLYINHDLLSRINKLGAAVEIMFSR